MMSHAVRNFAFSICCALLAACESSAGTPADAGTAQEGEETNSDAGAVDTLCTVEPPTECPDAPPRFADVSPIFKMRCATAGCHVSDWTGPWPLDSYSHIADWADTIRDMLAHCTMPPPDAGMPLPNEESEKILAWIVCKTPK